VERAFYRCDKCGDERRTVEQRERAEQEAVAAMRAEHALLAPREIRQLRERHGLTAQQLGELLYGIPRGIVEGWERGRYVQNPQVDALLRSLDDPETLARRAARAGVALPPPPGSEPAPGVAPTGEGDAGRTSTSQPHASDAPAPTGDAPHEPPRADGSEQDASAAPAGARGA
jgi:DNA-binding transcriptional regulator YiaG